MLTATVVTFCGLCLVSGLVIGWKFGYEAGSQDGQDGVYQLWPCGESKTLAK